MFYIFQEIADYLTYNLLSIVEGSYIGNTVNFFIYDILKIGFMLVAINYIMAITRYYFPMEKVRDLLLKHKLYGFDYLLAALLGVITPFCSCSSIPLFFGFISAGIPLGVTFTFLISSPLVNESSLYLFPAFFGVKNTIIYNIVGIVISILGGLLIQKLNMGKYVKTDLLKSGLKKKLKDKYKDQKIPRNELIRLWNKEAMDLTKKVFPYVVLGVGVGAFVHGLVPEEMITKYLSNKSWWSVPVAALLGTPLYAGPISIIPIIEALIGKGVPMGTALAFMTSAVTVSIPEALMLSKIMKKQLLFTFFGITVFGIILMGYLFNAL